LQERWVEVSVAYVDGNSLGDAVRLPGADELHLML
jgi:hypothetical protein